MKFREDGLVDGLIECGFWKDDIFESIEVSNLVEWLKTQFFLLREKYENTPETGKRRATIQTIYLGGNEAPFGVLEANKSKFKFYFFHPEIIGLFESTDIEEISDHIFREATKVSKFNWIGMTPKL